MPIRIHRSDRSDATQVGWKAYGSRVNNGWVPAEKFFARAARKRSKKYRHAQFDWEVYAKTKLSSSTEIEGKLFVN